MTTKPKFNFTKNSVKLTEDEFKAEEAKQSGGKYLDVGTYTVEIKNADFHLNKDTKEIWCKNDPTWFNVACDFVAGDKAKRHFIQVPTKRVEYNPENSTKPLFCFIQFRKFMAALGVQVLSDPKVLNEVLNKYFSDPSCLNGRQVKITIAYTGPYIKYVDKEMFQVVNQDGSVNEVVDGVFTTREEALKEAIMNNIKYVKEYPEVTSIQAIDGAVKAPDPVEEDVSDTEEDASWE